MTNIFKLLLLFASLTSIYSNNSIVVNTTYGPVKGKLTYNGKIAEFLSIPYASPPVNNLRWKTPKLHTGWHNTTFDATQQPFGCPQHCTNTIPGICPKYTSEDCLILS
eukprot:393353_1